MADDKALWSMALLGNGSGYGRAVETAGDWCRLLGKDKKQSSVGVVFAVGDGDELVVVVKRRRTVADGGGRWP